MDFEGVAVHRLVIDALARRLGTDDAFYQEGIGLSDFAIIQVRSFAIVEVDGRIDHSFLILLALLRGDGGATVQIADLTSHVLHGDV